MDYTGELADHYKSNSVKEVWYQPQRDEYEVGAKARAKYRNKKRKSGEENTNHADVIHEDALEFNKRIKEAIETEIIDKIDPAELKQGDVITIVSHTEGVEDTEHPCHTSSSGVDRYVVEFVRKGGKAVSLNRRDSLNGTSWGLKQELAVGGTLRDKLIDRNDSTFVHGEGSRVKKSIIIREIRIRRNTKNKGYLDIIEENY